jgi:hypothetical protein
VREEEAHASGRIIAQSGGPHARLHPKTHSARSPHDSSSPSKEKTATGCPQAGWINEAGCIVLLEYCGVIRRLPGCLHGWLRVACVPIARSCRVRAMRGAAVADSLSQHPHEQRRVPAFCWVPSSTAVREEEPSAAAGACSRIRRASFVLRASPVLSAQPAVMGPTALQ